MDTSHSAECINHSVFTEEMAETDLKERVPAAPNVVQGSCWRDVCFKDQSEFEVNMFTDTSANHEFLARGRSYMRDGKKVPTGDAVYRLVVSEILRVEGCERYDHVALMGRVKERLDALRSISNPPDILVMNFQYPGQINHIAIFCSCPTLAEISDADTEDTNAFKQLWSRFKDSVPHSGDDTSEERLGRFEGESDSWGFLKVLSV